MNKLTEDQRREIVPTFTFVSVGSFRLEWKKEEEGEAAVEEKE